MNAVAFAGENDSVLVSAGFDRTVRFFDARAASRDAMQIIGGVGGDRDENETENDNETFRDAVTSVAVSDTKILAGSVDGTVKTFDVRAGLARSDDFGNDNPVVSVAFSGDGACALVGAVNDRLALLDIEEGSILAEYRGRTCRHAKVSARLTHDDAHVVAAAHGVVTVDLVDANDCARRATSPPAAVTALDAPEEERPPGRTGTRVGAAGESEGMRA